MRLIGLQRKRPAIALTQPLNDAQTQSIPVRRRRLGRDVPLISVTAHLIDDEQLVLLDENRDRSLPVERVLERISYQITDRDTEGLWMSADSGICDFVDLNIDALAAQQMALLIYRPAHQRHH